MKTITITRTAYFPWATIGEIEVDNFRAQVLELPWKDNEQNVSCIPAGTYRVKRGTFKGHYDNYEIQDVPGRANIEMHRGNMVKDTHGCPLIGTFITIDTRNRTAFLGESTLAFQAFMTAMAGAEEATLEIRENCVSTQRKG